MSKAKNDLSTMSREALEEKAGSLREAYFVARFQNGLKRLENPMVLRNTRRELARVLTNLKQK